MKKSILIILSIILALTLCVPVSAIPEEAETAEQPAEVTAEEAIAMEETAEEAIGMEETAGEAAAEKEPAGTEETAAEEEPAGTEVSDEAKTLNGSGGDPAAEEPAGEMPEAGGEGEDIGEDPAPDPDAAVIAVEIVNQSETIEGDVSIADRDRNVTGVLVNEDEGKAIEVTVNGDVTAQNRTDYNDQQGCTAVEVNASGEGSEAAMTVNGDVTATNVWTAGEDMNLDNAGVSAWVGEDGKATVTVNGDIYAAARLEGDNPEEGYTWSAGAGAYNSGGELTVIVNGDVTAESTSYAVGLNVKNDEPGNGITLVQVNGDVQADTLAIRAENAEGTRMEIIVNGTVEASKDGISLEGAGNGEVLLTFWKAETSEAGSIIRADQDVPEEQAAAMEAAIQYIIRVAEKSASYITTDAREYREFRVAREGETVTLKISVPDGYEIDRVFGQHGEQMALTKDAAGHYFLQVPKGGGIELSVNLKALPQKKGQAKPSLKPAEDTPQTKARKAAIQSAEDLFGQAPGDILSRVDAGKTAGMETATLKLNWPDAARTAEDASFSIRTARAFAEGEKADVLIALPAGEDFEWYLVPGIGRADGKLRITLTADQVRRLAGRIFLAFILY